MSATAWLERISPYWVHRRNGELFVFVPKCGSNSIFRGRLKGEGAYTRLLKHRISPPKNAVRSYGFCRNPFDRAVSLYEWQRHEPGGVEGFLEFYKSVDSGQVGSDEIKAHARSCSWYLYEAGQQMVDTVYRFEEYRKNFREIFNDSLPIPHRNRTNREPSTHYYQCPETIELVCKIYNEDFERFGYARDL